MFDFRTFANIIAAHFAAMSNGELFRVAALGDDIWDMYLAAFPEGTNPLYRTRTYHDGSYDRAFVRKMGNVVSINSDGTLTSIWDAPDIPYPFNEVCQVLSSYVKEHAIAGLFRSKEEKLGVVSNVERLDDGGTHQWHHFHADVAAKHRTPQVDTVLGEANTTVQVFRRGLTEITREAVDTVLELIDSNVLYRGTEFRPGIAEFRRLQHAYHQERDAPAHATEVLLWTNYKSPAARLRNTAIGQLLQDLSEGKELEKAVKAFESMVAPTNYKRPTALITPTMIAKATETIRELGLESALERRFATIEDLSVNNVLWVDNSVRGAMRDGLTDLLMSEVKSTKPAGFRTDVISIDDFMQHVLPSALGMEIFFSNALQSSLMSLTAPVHADAGSLFKWDNNFGWSYNGNITDSIKQKVKAAGGNVDAALRVSLAWSNYDDLDLHCEGPEGHIYYGAKAGGGHWPRVPPANILDVDMNAGGRRESRSPVENLSWAKPQNGVYTIKVDNYCKVETQDQGFTLEVANAGGITQFSFPTNSVKHMKCLKFTVENGVIIDLQALDKGIFGQGIAQNIWGISTEAWVKVNTVLNSPNHWDGERTGNKHWFFILQGCQNPEPARGIYNEFLKSELETHRKVFEVLGNKTKCTPTADQLSGLGFSSTKRDSVTIRVTNASSTKTYEVVF